MTRQLQITKVTKNERITLGEEALETLGIHVGDRVQIYEDGGRVIIAPILPPRVPKSKAIASV